MELLKPDQLQFFQQEFRLPVYDRFVFSHVIQVWQNFVFFILQVHDSFTNFPVSCANSGSQTSSCAGRNSILPVGAQVCLWCPLCLLILIHFVVLGDFSKVSNPGHRARRAQSADRLTECLHKQQQHVDRDEEAADRSKSQLSHTAASRWDNQMSFQSREKRIRKALDKIKANRELLRKGRVRKDMPVIAVVGYTNAGARYMTPQKKSLNVFVSCKIFSSCSREN